jgi:uncharacterized membrane-anchored protein YjiN (DUF445 family)
MGLRTAISKKLTRLLEVVFGGFILLYFAVGFYFFLNGLVLISGGGLLIALACWGGVALFATPLWLIAELKAQSELLRYQTQLLRVLAEDSSRSQDVPQSTR